MILDYVALGSIIFMAIGITAAVVVTGSLPGKIARQRNHPWPDAVNVAGWIGLATGILWPRQNRGSKNFWEDVPGNT